MPVPFTSERRGKAGPRGSELCQGGPLPGAVRTQHPPWGRKAQPAPWFLPRSRSWSQAAVGEACSGSVACLCWAHAICQGARAYYPYIRGANSPFSRKSVSDKNKWAILFLLLREEGMKGGGSLCVLSSQWECQGCLRAPSTASVPSAGGRMTPVSHGKKQSCSAPLCP